MPPLCEAMPRHDFVANCSPRPESKRLLATDSRALGTIHTQPFTDEQWTSQGQRAQLTEAFLTALARQHPLVECRKWKRIRRLICSLPDDSLFSALGKKKKHGRTITSFMFNAAIFSLISSAVCRKTDYESSDANETQQSDRHRTQSKEKTWNLSLMNPFRSRLHQRDPGSFTTKSETHKVRRLFILFLRAIKWWITFLFFLFFSSLSPAPLMV